MGRVSSGICDESSQRASGLAESVWASLVGPAGLAGSPWEDEENTSFKVPVLARYDWAGWLWEVRENKNKSIFPDAVGLDVSAGLAGLAGPAGLQMRYPEKMSKKIGKMSTAPLRGHV